MRIADAAAPALTPRRDDAAEHQFEMASRLVEGRLLMTRVLADAGVAVTVLRSVDGVDPQRVGVLGHSYGGHVALFHAALDDRVGFAGISGALGSLRGRISSRIGIGPEQVVPGILQLTDFGGVLGLLAPRPTLVVSATRDPYAADAAELVDAASAAFRRCEAAEALTHVRVDGAHALDDRRFQELVAWCAAR